MEGTSQTAYNACIAAYEAKVSVDGVSTETQSVTLEVADKVDEVEQNKESAKTGEQKHLWKPGASANPAGRPKIVREVALLARSYTTDAIRVLAEIMLSKKSHTPSRVRAAELLLERGYGKAPAVLNVVHHLGSQELEEAARAILKKRDEASRPKVIDATLTKK